MAEASCIECGETVAARRRKCDDCRAPARATLTASEQRAQDAVAKRASGMTFLAIAGDLGYATAAGALKAYRRGMSADGHRGMSIDERRELELHRIDVLLAAIWVEGAKGDLAAVDRFERLSKRRERLEGLAIAPNGRGRTWDSDDDGDASGQVVSEGTVARMRLEREERARQRSAGPNG